MRRWYTKAFQLWESLSDEGNDAGVSVSFSFFRNLTNKFKKLYLELTSSGGRIIVTCESIVSDAGMIANSPAQRENFPDSSTLENGAAAFWYSDIVQDFKILSSEELIAGRNGVKWGYAFTSFAIDAPKYLKFLEGEIRSRGGVFIRSSLPIEVGLAAVLESVSNLVEKNLPGKEIFAFVHATGMGAKQLVGDEKIFPMKSQSVYIKGEANKIAGRLEVGSVSGDGYEGSADVPGIPIYYGSPRIGSGYTVLGGFMDEGNW
jgi:D-amino-acid oxidase